MERSTATVQYSISATNNPDKPIKLCIWEPAVLTDSRVRPFHFKANYICETLPEAMEILRQVETESQQYEAVA
ncbi:MAG: hypothetical protein RH949_29595 [Coleofasciculus sp. A1-SPW-01]|uniref:hypothetical protein n=1 Tax=Coleofasciculus TaxID=669368 RepID=UPI0005C4DC9B|nr:hypothetical protein [Coleofasciculus chthonoplastes]